MITSFKPITFDMIRVAADRAIYAVGLGFGFYIMLGSFIGKRFSPEKIISIGILIQLILGIIGTFAIINFLGASESGEMILKEYAQGEEEEALAILGYLPTIISSTLILALIGIAVFLAGLTSILPTSEVALQIIQHLTRKPRTKAALWLFMIVLLVGLTNSAPEISDMFLKCVSAMVFIVAIFELLPIITTEKKLSIAKVVAGISALIFLIGFGLQIKHIIEIRYYISLALVVILFIEALLWEKIAPQSEEEI
ncbi:hypothetical protein PFDSM3638_08745 [Pyrococcus furiosus DSM 3638]|uniref:Uncharacterized protein n=2 Tax=Pyrococcus furiosus (strain ATCC 43587 / DSM 3638 / JCM 8422 / Vc1) TaxID=186497 RepID=A0A5C0XRG0_PYRFU|nr:hypothetical protein PF1726 [Pyrococcus furiosus DSM 3638]QEK79342.1 hypothetical protein PFDSM3638_08745 [Pyrococcus furiosus DSM 3638]